MQTQTRACAPPMGNKTEKNLKKSCMIIQQPLINYWRFGHVGYMGWGGGILFPPLQTQTQTLRAVRAAGGKKKTKNKRNKTKQSCMIIHKTLEIWTKLRGQN